MKTQRRFGYNYDNYGGSGHGDLSVPVGRETYNRSAPRGAGGAGNRKVENPNIGGRVASGKSSGPSGGRGKLPA